MLQEASIVQDWINEGIEKGIEKGKKSGKLEALQEGILDVLEGGNTRKKIPLFAVRSLMIL